MAPAVLASAVGNPGSTVMGARPRGQSRQGARVADLIDRVDTVAAAALGDVERVVEDGESAEIIVLAGLVGWHNPCPWRELIT